MTADDKVKFIKKVMSYLFIKKKVYWINRIASAKSLDTKYAIANKIKTDDLGA